MDQTFSKIYLHIYIYIYIYDSRKKSIEKDEGINRRHIGTWDFNAWYVHGSIILVN